MANNNSITNYTYNTYIYYIAIYKQLQSKFLFAWVKNPVTQAKALASPGVATSLQQARFLNLYF